MDAREWKRLKASVEKIFDPKLGMQVHHTNFSDLRYWITIGDEIVWDFPSHFLIDVNPNHPNAVWGGFRWNDRNAVYFDQDAVFREYLDRPRKALLDHSFGSKSDRWGLGQVLVSADRRLAPNRVFWWAMQLETLSGAARRVCELRRPIKKSGDRSPD